MTEREHHGDTLIELGAISEETLGNQPLGQADVQPGNYISGGIQQAD